MEEIDIATTEADLDAIRDLFREYAEALGIDLSYQGFEAELAALPGAYAPPAGRILLAKIDGEAVGCIALRPFAEGTCEMKRLYVRPIFQKHGLGRALCTRLIGEARGAGYISMLLDTLPHMHGAIRLYESFGFARRDAYYQTPIEGTVFMQLDLQ